VSWAYNNTVSDNNTADRNFSFLQSLRRDGNIQSIQQSLQWKNRHFDYHSSLIESHVHEFLVELFLLHFAVFQLLVKLEKKNHAEKATSRSSWGGICYSKALRQIIRRWS
jgi:hypothetical protein